MNDAPARSTGRGRGRLRLLSGGVCAVALAAALALSPGTAHAQIIIPPPTITPPGPINGQSCLLWTDGGGWVSAVRRGPGNCTVQWSNATFVAGVGWNPGGPRTIRYSGTFQVTGSAYLSLYGWTMNPLVEYTIVEDYSGVYSFPPTGTYKGTVVSDGGVYDIYETQRVNQPSIIGTATFNRYWAIRRPGRTGGTLTMGTIFDAWASHGMPLGDFDYMIFGVEAYQSSGSASITVQSVGDDG